MNDALLDVVGDALTYLSDLGLAVPPQDARKRLRSVQARHPEVGMELVWESESFDGSTHFDVLLRPGDGTTVSLSVCADGALPWPLRGVRRWSDAELAHVNGQLLTMREAVDLLDVIWIEAPIMARMINVCLIREELERHPIEIDDVELQAGLDALRRGHGLNSVEETARWMAERGMTHERLEQLAADKLSVIKLRDRISDGRVASYFEANRAAFETARVARLELADETSASQILQQVRAGEIDFYGAAERHCVATRSGNQALFVTLRRQDISEEAAATLFSAATGDILGPFRIDGLYTITRVLSIEPAVLDDRTEAKIKEILFGEWLAERRATARVIWHWGTSDRAQDAS